MSLEIYFNKLSPVCLKYSGFILFSSVFLICGLLVLHLSRRQKLNLPSGPIGFPIIGYLPFLGKEPFRTFDILRKKYGNVFSLYMGRKYVVILGDYTAVKEAFNQSATLDRPEGIFDFVPGGVGVGGFNGAKWVEQRRALMKSMKDLCLGRSKWEQLVQDEVSDFLQVLANTKGAPADIEEHLMVSMINNVTSLVFGKKLPPGPQKDMLNSALRTAVLFSSQAGLWNFFSWLLKIMVQLKIGVYHKWLSEIAQLNTFVKKEIEMHKKAPFDSESTDYVSSCIKANMNLGKEIDPNLNESVLIGNTQGLFVAASETTHTSLMWLLLAMTTYPNIQRNVHEELDSVIGRIQKVSWKDRSKLPYTYAVNMEAQRWKTTAPLGLLRIASEDFKVCGYDIPKGSLIIPNTWALHNDSRYWKEPEDFIPERFLQNGGKEINLKLESYAPFSLGKRRCPGETVALMAIFLHFTSIMQQYEVRVPKGRKPNLEAVLGTTYMPVPQDLCFVQR